MFMTKKELLELVRGKGNSEKKYMRNCDIHMKAFDGMLHCEAGSNDMESNIATALHTIFTCVNHIAKEIGLTKTETIEVVGYFLSTTMENE